MTKPRNPDVPKARKAISTNHRNSRHASLAAAGARPRPLIAVFGSSQPQRGDQLYEEGIRLGEVLARSGFDVMNGGYQGVMEAVSRGAREGGAQVIGVTMQRFEDRVNRFVGSEIRTANFYERFGWLVNRADAYIAMHGGIGTLAEVTFTWQEILLGMLTKRPLILLGQPWRKLHEVFKEILIPTPHIYEPLTFAETPEEAAATLADHFHLTAPVSTPAK